MEVNDALIDNLSRLAAWNSTRKKKKGSKKISGG